MALLVQAAPAGLANPADRYTAVIARSVLPCVFAFLFSYKVTT